MPLATFRMGEAYNAIDSSLILDLDAANYPGTGNTLNDATRNGNNGTFVSGTGYSTANNGVMIFDGVDDYVSIGNLGNLYASGTISFWMFSTLVENYRNVFSTNFNGNNDAIRFEQYTTLSPYGSFNVVVSNSVLFHKYSPTALLVANTWYHVVFTWNKVTNNVTGYLNGIQQFDEANAQWPTTMPSVGFGGGFDINRRFKGNISTVKIYNRALSAYETTQQFQATRARYGI